MDRGKMLTAMRRLTNLMSVAADGGDDEGVAERAARVFVHGVMAEFARGVGPANLASELGQLIATGLASDIGACLICLDADAGRDAGKTICVDCEFKLDDPEALAEMLGIGDDEDDDDDGP